MKSPSAALLDAGAVALSSLCLLHCLALPLLAATHIWNARHRHG